MKSVKSGDTVKVNITGKLADGTVFDSSKRSGPLSFKAGAGEVIPGLEKAVMGMTPGDTKTVNIPAGEAYGPHRQELVVDVDRNKMPENMEPKEGQKLEMHQPDGKVFPVKVVSVTETKISLDANHPLAGKELTFDIEVLEVV